MLYNIVVVTVGYFVNTRNTIKISVVFRFNPESDTKIVHARRTVFWNIVISFYS